jgi:hypothetical protein
MNCLQKSLTILLVVVSTLCFTGCPGPKDSGKCENSCNESAVVIEDNNSFKNEIEQLKDVQEDIIKEQEINEANKKEEASKIAEEVMAEKAVKDSIIEQVKESKELSEK